MSTMKIKNIILTYLLSVIIILMPACKKFVEVGPPKNELSSENIFLDDETARAAMVGVYSELMRTINYFANGGLTVFPALSADELTRVTSSVIYDAFTDNALQPNTTGVSANFWGRAYFYLYQVNSILEKITDSPINESLKKQITGEAFFFRAFVHFYMVNLFGEVPLITSSDYRVNSTIRRSAVSDVYKQVINDLIEAKKYLSVEYPGTEKDRVNYWSAVILLARTYLYMENWQQAEVEATEIINSNKYSLTTLPNAFLPNNPEAILQFVPPINTPINTTDGFNFVPSNASVRPAFIIRNELLNAFEPGDQRMNNWISFNTVGGIQYYYPFKYKIWTTTTNTPRSEYYNVFRFAEAYLIRAEARIQLDKFSVARDDLNIIRSRAGLPNITSSDKDILLDANLHERRCELFVEWGHRWFDLRRFNKVNEVLTAVKGDKWQRTDVLYPIPQAEIEANPNLTQNDGY